MWRSDLHKWLLQGQYHMVALHALSSDAPRTWRDCSGCKHSAARQHASVRDVFRKVGPAERDLAHSNRLSMMAELAASLVHEITQPIAAARNNARAALNFLNKGQPHLVEVEEALGCIIDDADRVGAIIDRMCDHLKKAPPKMAYVDPNAAIGDVIGLARSTIETNGVLVRTKLAEDLRHIHGDRVQLQQVILNLVLNAVDAMRTHDHAPRELLISTENGTPYGVVIAVRDSGPGIEPDRYDRIFDPFYTTKADGIGIGLSICRSIVNAHGGRLWAEANVPHGASFNISLPCAETRS